MLFFKIALYFFISFFAISVYADNPITVSYNARQYVLEHPIITRHDLRYISVTDLGTLFDMGYSYSKKLDAVVLKNDSHSLSFIRHSSEVWLNHTRHYLSQASLSYKGILFVPLSATLRLLQCDIKLVETAIAIIPHTGPQLDSEHPLVSFDKRHADATNVSLFNLETLSTLHYKHHSIPILKSFTRINKRYYFDATQFFSTLGYTQHVTPTELVLSYKHFTYTIPFDSRIWEGNDGTTSWYFSSESPVIKKENHYLFPANSFFSFLDYSLHQPLRGTFIDILDPIHKVTLSTSPQNPLPQITLHSRHSLMVDLMQTHSDYLIQTLSIPFSIAYTETPLIPANPAIQSLSIRPLYFTQEFSHDNTTRLSRKQSKLTLKLKKEVHFFPLSLENGLTISNQYVLKDATVTTNGQFISINLSGISPILSPTIYQENNMLILDFKHTLSHLPRLKKINHGPIRAIRSSQLSYTPLVTRFVIDFVDTIPTYNQHISSQNFTLNFPITKKTSPALPVIKPSSHVTKHPPLQSKSRSKSRKKTVLSNRVIVLDPGHGGRDPGAVVGQTLYEKTYTLDIAKRLKTLLEKEGAYVMLTRQSDKTRSLNARTTLANRYDADIFLSLHLNTFSKSSVHGSKTFYYKYKDKKLAQHIQKQLCYDLKSKNNGTRKGRLYVLRYTQMPATLIEPLFLTNPSERNKIKNPEYRQKLALSIFQGIKNYMKDS